MYKKWLVEREQILKDKGKDHNFIFIKSNGDPATKDVINYSLRKWEKFLAEDTISNPKHEEVNLYAHCFRHYLCTLLTKKGISQELIVAIFGWKSADMYNIYNDCAEDERNFADLDKLTGVF